MRMFRLLAVWALLFASLAISAPALACPFCSAPSLTMTEQLSQSDAAVLVKWSSADKGGEQNPGGDTTYEVIEVLKGPADAAKKGDHITLARYREGQGDDLFLVMGTKGTVIEWGSPVDVTEASYKYVAEAPSPETPVDKRLPYFLKFLEHPDPFIANDSYAEFANAPYKDIALLKDAIPREKVRAWVSSADTPSTRLGLYGMLLGLCGTAEDAKLMESKINQPTQDFRLGIDGIMSGYLLITGSEGLNLVDNSKLKDKQAPFSETYAAMQALRFIWTYAPEKIEKERLRQSMRTLLDRPELADLVIADLARWKDWSIHAQLMDLYVAPQFDSTSIKRAIIRYMLVLSKDMGDAKDGKEPEHVKIGKEHLAALREKDPKTVREAERFFFLN